MGAKRTKDKKKAANSAKPAFDENALAALTSKIDKTLGGFAEQATTKRKRQREADDEPDSKRRQTKTQKEQKTEGKDKHSVLLDEILALGGDEADLELVANLDSDNEDSSGGPKPKSEQEASVDESLRNELAQFASALGFHKLRAEVEDAATDEEDEVEDAKNEGSGLDDEDDGEGDEDEDQEEVEEHIQALAAPKIQENRQEKKGKLVSKQCFEVESSWDQKQCLTCYRSSSLDQIGMASPQTISLRLFQRIRSHILLLLRTSRLMRSRYSTRILLPTVQCRPPARRRSSCRPSCHPERCRTKFPPSRCRSRSRLSIHAKPLKAWSPWLERRAADKRLRHWVLWLISSEMDRYFPATVGCAYLALNQH